MTAAGLAAREATTTNDDDDDESAEEHAVTRSQCDPLAAQPKNGTRERHRGMGWGVGEGGKRRALGGTRRAYMVLSSTPTSSP